MMIPWCCSEGGAWLKKKKHRFKTGRKHFRAGTKPSEGMLENSTGLETNKYEQYGEAHALLRTKPSKPSSI